LVKRLGDGLKILGDGEVKSPLLVSAHAFSKSAREKIEKAGGKAEVIPA
jgi:large subunit ribosomal protein L15